MNDFDFDREVNRIGRRKALAFFAKRLLIAAVILYFAIAAYGRYHRPPVEEYVCPCNECDCGPPLDELPPDERSKP